MALRASLGAGRGRLVRQLLTESVLLGALGGSLGLLVSAWTLDGALSLYPEALPGSDKARVDGAVLLFALGLSLGTVILFGLLPAISIGARRPKEALAAGGRRSTGARRPMAVQRMLVVAEVGLSLTLLVGAGLLLRSFLRLSRVDLGFDPGGVLTFSMSPTSRAHLDPDSVRRLYSGLLERASGVSGVETAAIVSSLPLGNRAPPDDFLIENRPEPLPGETAYNADYVMVSDGFFETLRIPLRRGRTFSPSDAGGAPLVAVVNERAARMYWPGEDPLGQRIRYYDDDAPWITIVGTVGDVRSTRLDLEPRPAVYVPIAQSSRGPTYDENGNLRSVAMVVRVRSRPEALTSHLRAVLRERDPSLPISTAMAFPEVVSRAASQPRFTSLLMGVFAATALLLAVVGIYGVVSYSVEAARQAIGIRMALGATPSDVLRLVMGQGAVLGLSGVGFGLLASLLLSRALAGLLYRVDPFDPWTLASLTALLLSVVLLASYLPARRAARVSVIETLRHS
jgi:predicted permease